MRALLDSPYFEAVLFSRADCPVRMRLVFLHHEESEREGPSLLSIARGLLDQKHSVENFGSRRMDSAVVYIYCTLVTLLPTIFG